MTASTERSETNALKSAGGPPVVDTPDPTDTDFPPRGFDCTDCEPTTSDPGVRRETSHARRGAQQCLAIVGGPVDLTAQLLLGDTHRRQPGEVGVAEADVARHLVGGQSFRQASQDLEDEPL